MKIPFNVNLTGKTAIVTGGSGTLCSAMAYGLAVSGAKTAIIGRNKANMEKVVNELTSNALKEHNAAVTIKGYCSDVTDKEELTKTYEAIKAELGSCDVGLDILPLVSCYIAVLIIISVLQPHMLISYMLLLHLAILLSPA